MNSVFKFADGSRLKGNAQAVGSKLHELREARGVLTRALVLKAATPKSSVLHRYFTWKDSVAANNWRLEQARHLIASVVTVKSGAIKTQPVRSFVKINDSYEPLEVVMNDSEMRAHALKEIYATIEHLKKKIKAFEGFADVFKSLGQVQAIIERKMKPTHMNRGNLPKNPRRGTARLATVGLGRQA